MEAVQINLIINQSADRVWEEWTDPEKIRLWFGSDPGGKVDSISMEVKQGGIYRISFSDSDGTSHTCFGHYLQIEPERKLSFTWEWLSEPGYESKVEVTFYPVAGGTKMKFKHSHLNPESLHGYEEGWKRTFEKMINSFY